MGRGAPRVPRSGTRGRAAAAFCRAGGGGLGRITARATSNCAGMTAKRRPARNRGTKSLPGRECQRERGGRGGTHELRDNSDLTIIAIWGRSGPLLGGRIIKPVRRSRFVRYNLYFTMFVVSIVVASSSSLSLAPRPSPTPFFDICLRFGQPDDPSSQFTGRLSTMADGNLSATVRQDAPPFRGKTIRPLCLRPSRRPLLRLSFAFPSPHIWPSEHPEGALNEGRILCGMNPDPP